MAFSVRRLAGRSLSASDRPALARDECFEAFYRTHFPRLVMEIQARTGDRSIAEDIAQETLARAYSSWDQLDPDRPAWPWLKTVAVNLSIDYARRHTRETTVDEVEAPATHGASLSLEDCDLLNKAMQELPSRQRVAVSLKYLDDFDTAQGARFLGITPNAFEQLLHRGRIKLLANYKRLSKEALGLALLPLRGLRSLSLRIRRAFSSVDPSGQLGLSIPQAAHVLVALTVTAGTVATLPVDAPRLPGASIASTARSHHPHKSSTAAAPSSSGAAGSGNTGHSSPSSTTHEDAPGAADPKEIVNDFADPNRHVRQPEDAFISGVAFSPGYSRDGTMFASGVVHCRVASCPPVLFRSTDGGATWRRLKAQSLGGTSILLPPAFGSRDSRIFAMGGSGLQVSRDHGSTFQPAAVGGASYAVGSVAISPAFNSGDPSILIGSQNMMRYDDRQRVVSPAPYTSLPGPLEPAYAPSYPVDHRLIVGGVNFDPLGGGVVSVVFRCTSETDCVDSFLGPYGSSPKVRLAPDFSSSNVVGASIAERLFLSRDGAASFARLEVPWTSPIQDFEVSRKGDRIFVAVSHFEAEDSGLYRSLDGGQTWVKVRSQLFSRGVETIAVQGNRMLVGLTKKGIACSTDGRHWSRRCG